MEQQLHSANREISRKDAELEQLRHRLREVIALEAFNRRATAAQVEAMRQSTKQGGGKSQAKNKTAKLTTMDPRLRSQEPAMVQAAQGTLDGSTNRLVFPAKSALVSGTPTKKELMTKKKEPRFKRYEMVTREQRDGNVTSTLWKGDMHKSQTGKGVSVVFKETETVVRQEARDFTVPVPEGADKASRKRKREAEQLEAAQSAAEAEATPASPSNPADKVHKGLFKRLRTNIDAMSPLKKGKEPVAEAATKGDEPVAPEERTKKPSIQSP